MNDSPFVEKLSGPSLWDFIKSEPDISTRLENVLVQYIDAFKNCDLTNVLKTNFRQLRNAGNMTWDEFVQARTAYMEKVTPK
jgi:hypothetical protein